MSGFNEDFDFKVPIKKDIWDYLNWYMYYEIGAEDYVVAPSVKHLKDLDLTGYDFSNMDLWGINFDNCNLSGCKFVNSNLYNANFHNCLICNSDFSDAVVEAVWFCNCKLSGTFFKGCSSYNFSFTNCVGVSAYGMVKERDQRAVAVTCEPLYRRGCCDSVMREINRKGFPLPDFSYFSTIISVDYPYSSFKEFYFRFAGIKYVVKSWFEKFLGRRSKQLLSKCLEPGTGKDNGGIIKGVCFFAAELDNFDLNGLHFDRCLFVGIKFPSGVLRDVTFSGCEFDNVDFSLCEFDKVKFESSLLFNPKVKQSQLKDFKQESSLYYDIDLVE